MSLLTEAIKTRASGFELHFKVRTAEFYRFNLGCVETFTDPEPPGRWAVADDAFTGRRKPKATETAPVQPRMLK